MLLAAVARVISCSTNGTVVVVVVVVLVQS